MASDERDVLGSGRTAAAEAACFSEDQLRAITSVVHSLLNEEFSAGRHHPWEESRGDDGRGSSKSCGNSRKRGGGSRSRSGHSGYAARCGVAGVGNDKGARKMPRSHARQFPVQVTRPLWAIGRRRTPFGGSASPCSVNQEMSRGRRQERGRATLSVPCSRG